MMEKRRQPPLRRTNCVISDTIPFKAKQSFDVERAPLAWLNDEY